MSPEPDFAGNSPLTGTPGEVGLCSPEVNRLYLHRKIGIFLAQTELLGVSDLPVFFFFFFQIQSNPTLLGEGQHGGEMYLENDEQHDSTGMSLLAHAQACAQLPLKTANFWVT